MGTASLYSKIKPGVFVILTCAHNLLLDNQSGELPEWFFEAKFLLGRNGMKKNSSIEMTVRRETAICPLHLNRDLNCSSGFDIALAIATTNESDECKDLEKY